MEPIHSLCLVEGKEEDGYPVLYDRVKRYSLENCAVIYAVEPDPTRTARNMRQHGVDVETLVESGLLTIVDRDEMYSYDRTELDAHALMDSWNSAILKVKKRSSFNGILAIGSAENFFEYPDGPQKLVKYEEVVGKKFSIPLESICCYSEKAIDSLSLVDLLALLNAHHSIIYRQLDYQDWEPTEIIEFARWGMDRALGGSDISDLFFKTLKLCYKIDERQIASDPGLIDRMLAKLMGRDAADLALSCIKSEVIKCIHAGRLELQSRRRLI